jgi:mutator protein MutT
MDPSANADDPSPRDRSVRAIRVVAALIEEDGRVLLGRRRAADGEVAECWEFPGGKVEPGESDESALVRELAEGLLIDVDVGARLASTRHAYADKVVELLLYRCAMRGGRPAATVHDEVRWFRRDEISTLRLAPADVPLLGTW